MLAKIPPVVSFRATGFPRMLPFNITLSVTSRCNSKCATCNIWRGEKQELALDELEKVFHSLGQAPYWFTMSGGEPFLRSDIVEVCEAAYEICRPGIINIPTNGLLSKSIPDKVREIAKRCHGTQIVVNLSLDGIGQDHDTIRGVPGNFDRVMETYRGLSELELGNFTLGVHSVVSRYNVDRFDSLADFVETLKPDSYIAEIAEERVELGTIGGGITPEPNDFEKAADRLIAYLEKGKNSGMGRINQAFRKRYYRMVGEVYTSRKQVIPCYAGFASAQIAANGDVWACCIRAESMGNLRDYHYNFHRIWAGQAAEAIRREIVEGKCYCPLANASYTNMLCHPQTLISVSSDLARSLMNHRMAGIAS
ncbi:MAG: radical SAM protein [Chloroflexi bacterium]|nr:radical SAM protein [Chloroflexota bacterium]